MPSIDQATNGPNNLTIFITFFAAKFAIWNIAAIDLVGRFQSREIARADGYVMTLMQTIYTDWQNCFQMGGLRENCWTVEIDLESNENIYMICFLETQMHPFHNNNEFGTLVLLYLCQYVFLTSWLNREVSWFNADYSRENGKLYAKNGNESFFKRL